MKKYIEKLYDAFDKDLAEFLIKDFPQDYKIKSFFQDATFIDFIKKEYNMYPVVENSKHTFKSGSSTLIMTFFCNPDSVEEFCVLGIYNNIVTLCGG